MSGHGVDHRWGLENQELTCPHIEACCTHNPFPYLTFLGEQARGHNPIVDVDTQPLALVEQGWFKGAAPHTKMDLAFIIIGKQELGFLIPERGPLEFIFGIPDLSPICSNSSRVS